MNSDRVRLWTDRSILQQRQYRTDANLAARQSVYSYQYPRIDLPAVVLDLAGPRGDETVADIGCGNGAYLAELACREHAGLVLGVDLSAGMLAAARRRAPDAALAAGDAAALPLRDHVASLTLAPHMLYHVPDLPAAIGELRIPAPDLVENYVRSTISVQNQPDSDAIAAAVASRFPAGGEPMHVHVHTGCLVGT